MSESGKGSRQRLAAILAADAAGYSRLMAVDEHATMAALDAAREVFRSQIEAQQGRVIDMAGDSVLAIFETATGAVSSALAIQTQLETLAAGVPADRRMRFRIGVHLGDVIEKADGSVYGDGVNIAARLEGLALPGGITVSDAVQGAVRHRIAATFEDMGEQQVKNIVDPVRVFRVVEIGAAPASARDARPATSRALRLSRWTIGAVGVFTIVALLAALLRIALPALRDGASPKADEAPLLSLAVLPFKPDAAPEPAFAQAFTGELTAALASSVLGAPVVAAEVVASHRAQTTDLHALGKALGVRYLLDGDFARDAGAVNVNLRLIDSKSGKQLWSHRSSTPAAKLADWPGLAVARATVEARVALYDAETRRLGKQAVDGSNPLELVFRAQSTIDDSTRDGIDKAKALCEQALRIEPDYAPALTCMAGRIVDGLDLGPDPLRPQLAKRAEELSRRAVVLASNDGYAWRIRGEALRAQYQWQAALEANARSMELDPTRSSTLILRAVYLLWTGQPEAVFATVARADELTQNIGWAQRQVCVAHMLLGHVDEAVASCERSVSENEFWATNAYMAAAYALKGDATKAAAARDRALARRPEMTVASFRQWLKEETDNAQYWERFDKTIDIGMRKAGFPEK